MKFQTIFSTLLPVAFNCYRNYRILPLYTSCYHRLVNRFLLSVISVPMKMQSLYLMLMIFSVGNLAQDFVQLYCGNDEYIRVIKIRKGGDFEGVMVRAECENSQGGRSKQTPIRYSTSGKDLVTTKLMINYVYLNQAVKKEQASRFCAADVCMCQSVNQLHNNQKMAKLVLFSTA